MKVRFTETEKYPCYEESEDGEIEIDIPEDKLNLIRAINIQSQRAHEYLVDLIGEDD